MGLAAPGIGTATPAHDAIPKAMPTACFNPRPPRSGQLTWINASTPCDAIVRPMKDMICDLPARLLAPDERTLVAEWLSGAGDITEAYVSDRHGDDPALYHRVVIATKREAGPTHLVHAPSGRDIWIVLTLGRRTKIRRFRTLRAALNSVRPVLGEGTEKSCQYALVEIAAGRSASRTRADTARCATARQWLKTSPNSTDRITRSAVRATARVIRAVER
jgi:hypothetical protein